MYIHAFRPNEKTTDGRKGQRKGVKGGIEELVLAWVEYDIVCKHSFAGVPGSLTGFEALVPCRGRSEGRSLKITMGGGK